MTDSDWFPPMQAASAAYLCKAFLGAPRSLFPSRSSLKKTTYYNNWYIIITSGDHIQFYNVNPRACGFKPAAGRRKFHVTLQKWTCFLDSGFAESACGWVRYLDGFVAAWDGQGVCTSRLARRVAQSARDDFVWTEIWLRISVLVQCFEGHEQYTVFTLVKVAVLALWRLWADFRHYFTFFFFLHARRSRRTGTGNDWTGHVSKIHSLCVKWSHSCVRVFVIHVFVKRS